jgi:hypothetical protein
MQFAIGMIVLECSFVKHSHGPLGIKSELGMKYVIVEDISLHVCVLFELSFCTSYGHGESSLLVLDSFPYKRINTILLQTP